MSFSLVFFFFAAGAGAFLLGCAVPGTLLACAAAGALHAWAAAGAFFVAAAAWRGAGAGATAA